MSRSQEVVVIDYGVGNLLSVQRGLEHVGAIVRLTSDPEQVLAAERVVLPGVGAFANAMQSLANLGLIEAIRECSDRQTPLLGICLGMQLLLDESEEFGLTQGLGLIPGRVVPIPDEAKDGQRLKIPHIGWNALLPPASDSSWHDTLLQDNMPGDAAYFVHSFMAQPQEPSNLIAYCNYGGHHVPAVIARGSVMGCQFHPEKSGSVGLKILRRFLMR